MADHPLILIPASDLIAFDDLVYSHPIKVDLVYAQPQHPDNMFKSAIYKPDAKMWAHRELVPIVLDAAQICFKKTGWIFELKDCLRPVEAQAKIMATPIVQQNQQWLQEPGRMFSPPGQGGHPRGMAIDIALIDKNGETIDMGTPFDHIAVDYRTRNPAARNFTQFSADEKYNQMVLYHRRVLEESMMQAAANAGRELLPLPQEWWDFRFPYAYSGMFEPIRDADLPAHMRMM